MRPCRKYSRCSLPSNWTVLRDLSSRVLSRLLLTGELTARRSIFSQSEFPAGGETCASWEFIASLALRRHGIHQSNDWFETPMDDQRIWIRPFSRLTFRESDIRLWKRILANTKKKLAVVLQNTREVPNSYLNRKKRDIYRELLQRLVQSRCKLAPSRSVENFFLSF